MLLADGFRVDGEFDLLPSLYRILVLFVPLLFNLVLNLPELTVEDEHIGLGAFKPASSVVFFYPLFDGYFGHHSIAKHHRLIQNHRILG